jgi:hypothetical protein
MSWVTRIHAHQPPKMPAVEYLVGGPVGRWFLKRGWAGVTLNLPFRRAVILYWSFPSALTRVHEFVHVEQGRRWGFWGFYGRYALGLRHGYRRNPLECEAYDVQTRAACEGLPAWACFQDTHGG